MGRNKSGNSVIYFLAEMEESDRLPDSEHLSTTEWRKPVQNLKKE